MPFLTTTLDGRSREYFVTVILGMLLGHRTPDGFERWLRAAAVQRATGRITTTSCKRLDVVPVELRSRCCTWRSGRFRSPVMWARFVKMVIDELIEPTKRLTDRRWNWRGLTPQSHAGTRRVRNFCMDMSGSRSVGWWRFPAWELHRGSLFGRRSRYARRKDLQELLQNIGRAPWSFQNQAGTGGRTRPAWSGVSELFKNWYRKRVMKVIVDGAMLQAAVPASLAA